MHHLTEQEKQALHLFEERLETVLPGRVERLLLFGSKARGDNTAESDIDVLVIMTADGGWETRARVFDTATDIFLETGIDISPAVYSDTKIAEMRRRRNMFIQSVDKDATAV